MACPEFVVGQLKGALKKGIKNLPNYQAMVYLRNGLADTRKETNLPRDLAGLIVAQMKIEVPEGWQKMPDCVQALDLFVDLLLAICQQLEKDFSARNGDRSPSREVLLVMTRQMSIQME